MQSGGAGMEGTDPKVMQSPLLITNYARTFSPGISETAIGLLLALSRGLVKHYLPQFYLKKTMVPAGTPKSDHHVELVGRTMGIAGMGGIGSAIARRAYYGLDMRIIATDAKPMPSPTTSTNCTIRCLMKMAPTVGVLAPRHTRSRACSTSRSFVP
jgi:lactate dehydrogenase-like 2-hydroxyacid dehydrogenase